MFTFGVIGLVLSLLAIGSTKQVAKLIAPKKESVFAIPRTLLSVFWFTFGPLVGFFLAVIFALVMVAAR